MLYALQCDQAQARRPLWSAATAGWPRLRRAASGRGAAWPAIQRRTTRSSRRRPLRADHHHRQRGDRLMARKSAENRLELARKDLAEAEAKIADLEARRRAALLADRDDDAIKLAAEIEQQRRVAGGHAEKGKLLLEEAEREAGERRLREHAALLGRFTRKLSDADEIAVELQNDLAQVERKFRAIISLREEARLSFAVHSSHARAAANSPEGCALAGGAIAALLAYELYRIGARPFLGGGQQLIKEVNFPGGLTPRVEWTAQPEKITPFAETLKRASEFAV